MSKDVDVDMLQIKDNITHLEEGASYGTDNQRQVAADFYVANAEMTPIEGGHFRIKFRILHKDTQQPPLRRCLHWPLMVGGIVHGEKLNRMVGMRAFTHQVNLGRPG